MKITRAHVEQIINQERTINEYDQLGYTVKNHKQDLLTVKILRNIRAKIDVDSALPHDTCKFVNQARNKGASAWLNAIPIGKQVLVINKLEFRDDLRLRYNVGIVGISNVSKMIGPTAKGHITTSNQHHPRNTMDHFRS